MNKLPVEIIAECGINAGSSLTTAMKMIDSAILAGADTVKFQLVDPNFYKPEDPLHKIFQDNYISPEGHKLLREHCDARKVNYLCTPSDVEMAKVLVNTVGVKRLKVASDSIKNIELHDYIKQTGLPCLVSTGMLGSDNIENLRIISKWYDTDVTIMHCISKYPCPDNELMLSDISVLIADGVPVGYSDHSSGVIASVIAVALGATVIEKHFKITPDCVDANVSLFPDDFSQMASLIRQTEIML